MLMSVQVAAVLQGEGHLLEGMTTEEKQVQDFLENIPAFRSAAYSCLVLSKSLSYLIILKEK